MAGPEVILAAEAIGTGAAAETAGAAMAAEAVASVNAANAAAAAAGTANPFLTAAYGSLPGMTMGSEQAAMLAAQTGEFGLPGLISTGGSATYAGAGGPLAKMAFSSGTPSSMRMGMQGMNMLQQSAPRPAAAPGIRRGQQVAQADFGQLLPQPIQRKRLSLL
jgi:hypothetical protein